MPAQNALQLVILEYHKAERLSGKRANHGLHPTRLSPLEIGGHTRFVVGLVVEAYSRSRRAGEANR